MGSDPLLTVVEVKNVWVLASIAVMKGSDPIKSTLCWRPMVDSCRPTSPKSGRQISAKSAYSFRLRAKPALGLSAFICAFFHAFRIGLRMASMMALLSSSPRPRASACSRSRRCVSASGRLSPAADAACSIRRTSFRCCESFA